MTVDHSWQDDLKALERRLSSIEDRCQLHSDHVIRLAVLQSSKQIFSTLGVDVDDPQSVQAFRDDLRFSNVLRHYTSKGVGALVLALFGAVGTAIGYFLLEGFRRG